MLPTEGCRVKYGMPTVFNPPPPIPDHIRLPDGRSYDTAELLSRVARAQQINLQTGRTGPGRTPKYTAEQREFLATGSIADIAERFGVDLVRARRMQYNSRIALGLSNRSVPAVTPRR